jgi:hypothetical protein
LLATCACSSALVIAVRTVVRADDGKLRFEAVEMPEDALQQALHAAVDEDRALR